jgi:hypothetical protein
MRALAIAGVLGCGLSAARAADVPVPPFVAVASVSATSFLANKKEPERYAPRQALVSEQDGPRGDDEGPETYSNMWCEGRPDEGVGETLTVTLTQPTRVDALGIAAGVWKSEKLFARNNLPTRLEVSIDGGAPQTVAIPSTRKRASVTLGGKPVRSIAIKIVAVKKGAINDTCLSSLTLLHDNVRMAPLFGLAPAAAAALPDGIQRVVAAVGANKLDALAAVGEFPLTVETADNCGDPPVNNLTFSKVTHKNAKAMSRDCLAYRKQELPSRSDPCLADTFPVDLRGGDGAVDVILHSICGGQFNPVYSLVWRAGVWRLSEIGTVQPEASP